MPRLNLFLSIFILFIPALLSSCKTTRPTVEISDKPYTPTAVAGPTNPRSTTVDDLPASHLKVGALIFPPDAKPYTRISLTLAVEGAVSKVIENYSLNDLVALKPYKTYTLTVRVYAAGILIYSNVTCTTGKDFKSKIGLNNYTVPLCAARAEGGIEENVPKKSTPTKTDATQTDSVGSPMQERPATPVATGISTTSKAP